jgi:hypothetical protein
MIFANHHKAVILAWEEYPSVADGGFFIPNSAIEFACGNSPDGED